MVNVAKHTIHGSYGVLFEPLHEKQTIHCDKL